jgi:RNA polymerase sigma-70 factor (ECF subfamily)
MQTAILLWKNKKKKYAVRNRILPESSLEEYMEQGGLSGACEDEKTPEQQMLNQAEIEEVQAVVAALPEKYRMPVYLNFSAGMTMQEIAVCLHIPLSTVKTRMRKAKALLKEQLEAIGYDG